MRIYIILHLYVMHRDIRRQFIQYNYIYYISTLYRISLYDIQLFTTFGCSGNGRRVRAQIFRVCPLNELLKFSLQTAFLRAASVHWIFRTCITSVSICSYASVSGTTSFMLYVDGIGGAGAFNNGAARRGIKGKFVKWYALRTVLRASSRIEWEAPPRKTTSNNENMKEKSNPHDWSRNHGDTNPRCLRGNIESSSITFLQNSLRRMHLDAPCRGLLHHMPQNIRACRFSVGILREFAPSMPASCTNPAGQ